MTLRVMTVLGTRPEIIRLACVMPALDAVVDQVIVHTGQSYDRQLNAVFFDELGLRAPDAVLTSDTSSLGKFLGDTLSGVELLIDEYRPDAMLILGDTNSAIAALIARRKGITVYHMEAGNRCFDENVPEEVNRRMVDHIADFNLVYTEHARRNLLTEGLHPRRIYLTGSPLAEVFDFHREQITASTILTELDLEERGYFLVSMHREENVDFPDRLRSLLRALEALTERWEIPAIVSTHPRTRKRLDAIGGFRSERLKFMEPFGFFDYNRLQQSARCVLSDSGTISEESVILGFPAVTIRDAIERPEALDSGSMVIAGLDAETISAAVSMVCRQWDAGIRAVAPFEYEIHNCSQRVVSLIIGTTLLNRSWSNLHERSRL
jgi:UDP-N-acetylglucosamine 2-epimerase (non-hydrolysing)